MSLLQLCAFRQIDRGELVISVTDSGIWSKDGICRSVLSSN